MGSAVLSGTPVEYMNEKQENQQSASLASAFFCVARSLIIHACPEVSDERSARSGRDHLTGR